MKKKVETHLLAEWVPQCSVLPHGWLVEFLEAESIYHKLGLLQFGLDLNPNVGYEDVVKTYFVVAEGHSGNADDISSLVFENNYRIKTPFGEKRPSDLAQIVARKAFEVICLKILKNTSRSKWAMPSWASFVLNEKNLDTLLHFFRLKNDHLSGIPKLSNLRYLDNNHDHHTMIAVEFLENLISFVWPVEGEWPFLNNQDRDRIKIMVKERRQKIIELMYGLGRLDLLQKRALQVNGSHMDWLKNTALKESACATIEDAVYSMNQAARVWHILSVIRGAHGRYLQIQRAEQKFAEAQEELTKLKE